MKDLIKKFEDILKKDGVKLSPEALDVFENLKEKFNEIFDYFQKEDIECALISTGLADSSEEISKHYMSELLKIAKTEFEDVGCQTKIQDFIREVDEQYLSDFDGIRTKKELLKKCRKYNNKLQETVEYFNDIDDVFNEIDEIILRKIEKDGFEFEFILGRACDDDGNFDTVLSIFKKDRNSALISGIEFNPWDDKSFNEFFELISDFDPDNKFPILISE